MLALTEGAYASVDFSTFPIFWFSLVLISMSTNSMMSLAELLFAVRPPARRSWGQPQLDEVPNPVGTELANNGEFGFV